MTKPRISWPRAGFSEHSWKAPLVVICILIALALICWATLTWADAAPVPVPVTDDTLGTAIQSLVSAFGGGQWLLGAALCVSVLTWLLHLLAERIRPTWLKSSWVPWIAAILGTIGMVLTAVLNGSSWPNAVITGVLVGNASSGLWSMLLKYPLRRAETAMTRKQGDPVPPPPTAIFLLAGATLLLAHTGCGQTVLQRLNIVNESTAQAMHQTRPVLQERANELIDECKTKGVTVKEQCPGYMKLFTARRAAYGVANSIHVAVRLGALTWLAGDEQKAEQILAQALKATEQLKQILQTAGIIDAKLFPSLSP